MVFVSGCHFLPVDIVNSVQTRKAWVVHVADPKDNENDFDGEAYHHAFTLVKEVPKGLPSVLNPLAASQSLDYQELFTASITIALLGYLEMHGARFPTEICTRG
jgi:hypothetical protein